MSATFDAWQPHDLTLLIGIVPDPVLAGHSDWLFEMWPTLSYWAAIDAAVLARHDGVRAAHLFEELFVHAGHHPRLRTRLQQAWHRSGGGVCLLAQGLDATAVEIIIYQDICCLRQSTALPSRPGANLKQIGKLTNDNF